MALPTDANVVLLVCDGARQTPDGKLDIAGYYPTSEVKIDLAVKLPASLNLTFVFVLKDGEGRFRAKHRIIDPLGKELHNFDVSDAITKATGLAHILFLPVGQIPIVNAGQYTTVLELDGQPYQRTVRIFQ
jgi:hypothetical protein